MSKFFTILLISFSILLTCGYANAGYTDKI